MKAQGTGDPFGDALERPMTVAAAEIYIRERVATLMQKSDSRAAAIKKILARMALHDGPPTKEENEEYIRLKYGPEHAEFDGFGKSAKRVPFEEHFSSSTAPSDSATLTSSSIGF